MALVHYTGKNVFGVGLAGVKDFLTPTITPGGDIVRFLPGINEIEDAILAKIKTHPLFENRVKSGLIKILHEKLGNDGKQSVEEILKNIPNIFDTKLLKKLIDTDGRDRVVAAAKEQLDNIKNPAKAKEKAANDEHFK